MSVKDVMEAGDEAAKRAFPWGVAAVVVVIAVVVAVAVIKMMF